jgi:hypothetical protein
MVGTSSKKLTFHLFTQEAKTNLPLQFQEGSELVIRVNDETLPIVTMRVHNPNRSPFQIHS